jgi:hypothetical protein
MTTAYALNVASLPASQRRKELGMASSGNIATEIHAVWTMNLKSPRNRRAVLSQSLRDGRYGTEGSGSFCDWMPRDMRSPLVPNPIQAASLSAVLLLLFLGCATPNTERETQPVGRAIATRSTVAEGIGPTRTEAIADARREAVRSVIGAFIAASSTVVNDQLVQSSVLSLSDGYVARSAVLREWRDAEGLYHVQLHAVVVDSPLSELELRRNNTPNPAILDTEGARDTQLIRTQEATALLADTLEQSSFPLGIFEVDPTGSTIRRNRDGGTIVIECALRVDRSRWNAVLRRMSRCLAALGAMDSPVRWRSRSIGGRIADLMGRSAVVGQFLGSPLTAHLTSQSAPLQPGPLDNVPVPFDASAPGRTVMFMETEPEICRAFTLESAAFDVIAPRITLAGSRRPMLRIDLVDDSGTSRWTHRTPVSLNVSTGVLLLAETGLGMPHQLAAGKGRSVAADGFAPARPLQIVPAIGWQDVLVREIVLRTEFGIDAGLANEVSHVTARLEW